MTGIEWTDTVWNPTTGCDRVTPGCDRCYAMTMAKRLKGMGQAKYQRDGDPRTSGPGFGITEHPDALDAPLRWRKPSRVFVNSMSDLFHPGVSDEFIASVFAVMAMAPLHTFQVLTKRHGRMRSLLNSSEFWRLVGERGRGMALLRVQGKFPAAGPMALAPGSSAGGPWEALQPLPNVWLGVSVEDQQRADLRIPALLGIPAAVRFLSCEPLLGPVKLAGRNWLPASENDPDVDAECLTCGTEEFSDRPGHEVIHCCSNPDCQQAGEETGAWCDGPIQPHPRVSWVIVGGESGPGARPMELAWARSIVQDCQSARVPVFVKQLGSIHGRALGGGKGGDPDFWPDGLNVREFPQAAAA